MPRRRLQLAIRSVMVVMALVAWNLAAAICVLRTHPREPLADFHASTSGDWIMDFAVYGLRCRFARTTGGPREVALVLREPLPPTLPEVWAPIIAGASITFLVLALSLAGPVRLRRVVNYAAEDGPVPPPSEWRQVVAWGTVAIALAGLNFAAIAYSPPLSSSDTRLARRYFEGGSYLGRADGTFAFIRPYRDLIITSPREGGLAQPSPDSVPSTDISADDGIKVTTICVENDGSVLGYTGRSGVETSNPIVLRGPSRCLLMMWSPVIASAIVTGLVVVQWLRLRRNRDGSSGSRAFRDLTRGVDVRDILKWAVVGSALAGLNGAGAIATWKARVRERACRVRLVEREAWGPIGVDENWDIRLLMGKLETGETLARVMWLPRRPTDLQVWSPVWASVSASFLVLTVLLGRGGSRLRAGSAGVAGELAARRSPIRLARCAMVAAALVALNAAAVVYGPFPEPGDERPRPNVFDDPAMVPDADGSLSFRDRAYKVMKKMAWGAERLATADDYPLPRHRFDSRTRVKDSIVYKPDGSVVAYDGNPGFVERLISRPRVIFPPTRSFLKVWWAVIVGFLFSLIVVCTLWRQTRMQFADSRSQGSERLN